MRLALAACALALVACRGRSPRGDAPTPTAGGCEALPYPAQLPIAEASGAAWLPDAGRLLIVADSGHDGAYLEVDQAGVVKAQGRLPIEDGGDDLEGLARDGATIWGVTSSGWMRAWRRGADGYTRIDSFAIDERCPPTSVNCGDNYEGLCLATATLPDGCDGYLAAKATGELVCLRRAGARFTRVADRRYRVSRPERLADCAIADDGTVWTGDNGFGLSAVRQWAIGADGARRLGQAPLGLGFPEVVAIGPEATIYRFSDLGGSPSLTWAYRCAGGLPKAGPAADGE